MGLEEAMASGTPIISTLTGSIPEVLGDAAMLIPPGDFAMLADNVIKLMEDRLLREELCRKGRERAERMYDADRVSGEFARVLKEI
ncbi:putative glycosyl transferase [bacterium BMS3Bbin09]|nr:putative glycosyl transferase [bacterium BMS3Bbin09]